MIKPPIHHGWDSHRKRFSALGQRLNHFKKLEAQRKAQGQNLTCDESNEYASVRQQHKALNDELRHGPTPIHHLAWQTEYWAVFEQFVDSAKAAGDTDTVARSKAHSQALEEVATTNKVNVKTVRDAILHAKGYNRKKLEKGWHPSDDQEPDEPPHF